MTKLEIFDDVVSIMEKDSSTCKDKDAGAFQTFRDQIYEEMADRDFVLVVSRYLATFEVPGHLTFYSRSAGVLPFSLRRVGDALYVTEADAGCGFTKGDKIVALGGLSIPEVGENFPEFLYGEPIERQLWTPIARLFSNATVERAGGDRETVPLALCQRRAPKVKYEFTRLSPTAVMLRFDDFAADEPIHALVSAHDHDILNADTLVIDVRNNAGGSDSAFYPLLHYCFDVGETPGPLDDAQEINHTERNVDLRLRGFGANVAPDSLAGRMAAQMKALRGKGFVLDEEGPLCIEGSSKPAHVYILSDYNCGSTGDAFVELARTARKVTVVGRPTMGILDYSNEAVMIYGDYVLMYPTSRRIALDRGIAMNKHGVPVDIYIPYSEEHLARDVDLETVLAMLD